MNQRKLGVIITYATMLAGFLVSVVYTPIMLRVLGQEEYGLYTFVLAVVSYLTLFSFGFTNGYIRFYSRFKAVGDEEGLARLNALFMTIYFAIGILVLIIGAILVANSDTVLGSKYSPEQHHLAKFLFAVLILDLALSFPISVATAFIMAHEKFVFQKSMVFLRQVIGPLVMIPVLLLGAGSLGLVSTTLSVNMIAGFWTFRFAIKRLGFSFKFGQFEWDLTREIFIFSSYLFLGMIINQINWNIGKFIIGRMNGPTDAAIVGLAAQLVTYFLALGGGIAGVFIPEVNRLAAEKRPTSELTAVWTRIGRIQFILLWLTISGFVIFGAPFIALWAGPQYHKTYPVAVIFIVPLIVPLSQSLGIEIQQAQNRHQFRSLIYLVFAILNVLLCIPLVKWLGPNGVGFATAFALIFGHGVAMNWYYHFRMDMSVVRFWRSLLDLLPSFLPAGVVGLLMWWYLPLEQPLILLSSITVYTAVFGIFVWKFGMGEYERTLVLSIVRRNR